MFDLDSIMQAALSTVAPAISIAICYRGEMVTEQSWGIIDPETSDNPVTPDSLFDLASLTKLFTTTALLTLLSQQKLSTQTPLHQIIPEFADTGLRPIEGLQNPHTRETAAVPADLIGEQVNVNNLTLWHLLTHTSGLAPWRDLYLQLPHPDESVSAAERWQLALPLLINAPFVNHTGAAVHYSDLGLLLLSEVVCRLNNSSLDKAIHTHVIDYLNVDDVMFNPLNNRHTIAQVAPTELDTIWRNHRVWGTVHDENAAGLGGIAGHAGLFASASSVAMFGQAWLQQSTFAIDKALQHQSITEQVETDDHRRGLGWMIRSVENSSAGELMSRVAYGHTGFTGTSLWIDPAHALVIALLTNRVYYGREASGIHQLRRQVSTKVMETIQ